MLQCQRFNLLKRRFKHLITRSPIHQMVFFCSAFDIKWVTGSSFFRRCQAARFRGRAGMRKAACVCSSCTMHQCLWDGSPGLGPDHCQDPGWAHYPDIIKGLKWKPFGDYSICLSATCVALISAPLLCRGEGWATRWRCADCARRYLVTRLVSSHLYCILLL